MSPVFLSLLTVLLLHAPAYGANEPDFKTFGRPAPPSNIWKQEGVAASHALTSFGISLKGEKFHELESKMMEIAKNRGEWLSSDQLEYYVAPSSAVKKRVESYLAGHGIEKRHISYSQRGNSMEVRTSAAQASKVSFDDDAFSGLTEIYIKAGNIDLQYRSSTPHSIITPIENGDSTASSRLDFTSLLISPTTS